MRKKSTSNTSRQLVLSKAGNAIEPANRANPPFKKNATLAKLLKRDQIQLVSTAQFVAKSKPLVVKVGKKNRQSNQLKMPISDHQKSQKFFRSSNLTATQQNDCKLIP